MRQHNNNSTVLALPILNETIFFHCLAFTLAVLAMLSSFQANATVTIESGGEYATQCEEAGVPTPKVAFNRAAALASNDPAQWTPRRDPAGLVDNILTNEFTGAGFTTEVYYWTEDNDGVCMILPRIDGSIINLLGVVCQSKSTGKSCFWDAATNVAIDDTVCFPGNKDVPGSSLPGHPNQPCHDPVPNIFVGGTELPNDDRCSDCHRGENAFVVHPNTAVDIGALVTSNIWSDPIVPDTWDMNEGPANYYLPKGGPLACATCHTSPVIGGRFPELSTANGKYCNRVLANALLNPITRTMPQGGPSSLQLESEALFDACLQPTLNDGRAAGRFARALRQAQDGRNATLMESRWIKQRLDSGESYRELQADHMRPAFRKILSSPPIIDGQVDFVWGLVSPPRPADTPVNGGRRNTPSISQLAAATATLNDPTNFFKINNDFENTAQQLVPTSTPANHAVEWRAAWTDSHLYILVDVVDDQLMGDSPNAVWQDDSVEIYIDGLNEKNNGGYDNNDFQYLFRPMDDTVYTGGGRSGMPTAGIIAKSLPHTNDNGYTMEIAIPWATLGLVPGRQIGFELFVNDDDDGGLREGQTSWRTTSTETWRDPSKMSSVNLVTQIVGSLAFDPVTIDGLDMEPDWSARLVHPIARVPAPINASDNTGDWRAFWDSQNLYFFVRVNDANVVLPHDSAKAYHDDSIEIFLDPGNSHNGWYDGHDDIQMIFTAGANGTFSWGDRSLNLPIQPQFKSVLRPGGYDVEIAIPWSSLKMRPTELATMGVEVQINDDDNGGNREGKRAWCSDNNATFANPRYFCVAKLFEFQPTPGTQISKTLPNDISLKPDITTNGSPLLRLDGFSSDILWSSITPQLINNPIISGPSLALGEWRAAWNREFLYLQVEVADATGPIADSNAWYGDDSVEVFISPNNSHLPSYGHQDVQYIFRPGDSVPQLGARSPFASTDDIFVASTTTSNGYGLEIAIPWSTIGALPEAGADLGLEIHINNDIDGGARDSKTAWFADSLIGDTSWLRSDVFAPVRLAQ